jgi:hypothetical protein
VHRTARGQRAVSDRAHQPDVPAAVHQPDATSRERRAQAGRALGEGGVDAAVGSAVNGD